MTKIKINIIKIIAIFIAIHSLMWGINHIEYFSSTEARALIEHINNNDTEAVSYAEKHYGTSNVSKLKDLFNK